MSIKTGLKIYRDFKCDSKFFCELISMKIVLLIYGDI